MARKAPLTTLPARGEVACVAADGCSYLSALSTIEHIAGFEHTARSYAAAADRCREHGCWAAQLSGGGAAPAVPGAADAVPLKVVRLPGRAAAAAAAAGEAETIPFCRSSLIDIVSDSDGNYVERRALKLHTLPARGDPLGYLYHYWLDLRGASALQFSNIDTVHLARAGVIGKLHVVDVSGGDPGDFRFELFGYALPLDRYEMPRALPVPIYANSTMRDYNTVRLTATPCLHHVRSRLGGISYHYTRLILPFVGSCNRVSRLLVAIRQEAGDGLKVESRN